MNQITQSAEEGQSARVVLMLDITYLLNGESVEDIVSRLTMMCERAVGDGMLTGGTDALVDTHSMDVIPVERDLDEDELAAFMRTRIEDGDLDLEDIPVRLARFGLQNPAHFINEMAERMDMAANGDDAPSESNPQTVTAAVQQSAGAPNATTNPVGEYVELLVKMRSKTTFGEDSETIRVWLGQSAEQVAADTAHGYGATVISILHLDGKPFVEPEAHQTPQA